MKEDPASPERYLGAKIAGYTFDDGATAWSISLDEYISIAVKAVEAKLAKDDRRLSNKVETPLSTGY